MYFNFLNNVIIFVVYYFFKIEFKKKNGDPQQLKITQLNHIIMNIKKEAVIT